MKKNKILCLIMAAFMLLMFAACGDSSNNNPPISKDNTWTEKTELSGTIKFAAPLSSADNLVMNELIYQYEKINPNVKVDIMDKGSGDSYINWVKSQMSDVNSATADIIQANIINEYFGTDKLVDFNDYIYSPNYYEDKIGDRFPAWNTLLDEAAYRIDSATGTIPTLSFESIQLVMFYNKDLFSSYNLQVPNTWTELLNLCEVISNISYQTSFGTTKEHTPISLNTNELGIANYNFGWLMRLYLDQYFKDVINTVHTVDGDYNYDAEKDEDWTFKSILEEGYTEEQFEEAINNDSPSRYTYNIVRLLDEFFAEDSNINMTSPRYEDMMENLKKLSKYGAGDITYEVSKDKFYAGETLMFVGTSDFFPLYQDAKALNVNQVKSQLGCFPLPAMEWAGTTDGKPSASYVRSLGGPSNTYGIINKNKAQSDLAVDFLKFLGSKKGMDIKYKEYESSNMLISKIPLVKNVSLPEAIDITGSIPYIGECDFNPITLLGMGYSTGKSIQSLGTVIKENIYTFLTTDTIWGDKGEAIYNSMVANRSTYFENVNLKEDCMGKPQTNPYVIKA
jgi:ABC-type glycerol-3-phosphate transport system substrate-binding protein